MMRDYPQGDHCDLGLVDDDATEDMRPKKDAARSHNPATPESNAHTTCELRTATS